MLALCLHPDETRIPRHRVRASARKIAGAELMTLRFEISGAENILCSVRQHEEEAEREDDLWKATCLECFIGGASNDYREWNFAPNGNWNAYDFESYRKQMRKAEVEPPSVARTTTGDQSTSWARFEIDVALGAELAFEVLKVSLTAVVLEKGIENLSTGRFRIMVRNQIFICARALLSSWVCNVSSRLRSICFG